MARARGLLLLASLLAAPWARAELTVDPVPAWAGHARHGAVTEVGVRLLAALAGPVEITLRSTRSSVTTTLDLAPAVAQTVYLPARVGDEPRLAIEVHARGQPPLRRAVDLHPLEAATAAVAVAAGGTLPGAADLADGADSVAFPVDAASLPRLPQSYAWIDALVLDERALAELDDRQREALGRYLAGCGQLALADRSGAALDGLRARAGCGGRRVGSMAPPAADGAASGADDDRADPRPEDLRHGLEAVSAAAGEGAAATELGAYFAAYGLVLALAAWVARRPAWLLATPVAAAAVGLAVWSQAAPTSRVTSWGELDGGDPAARFAALVRLAGHGPGHHAVRLPAHFGLPLATRDQDRVALRLSAGGPEAQLEVETRLLSEHAFVVSGTFLVDNAPALRLAAGGAEVVNPGDRPTAPALLAWQSRRHEVPALAPGEQWRPPAEGSAWQATPAEQALRARALREPALLLVPYSLADAGLIAGGADARGWLLVRPPARGPAS